MQTAAGPKPVSAGMGGLGLQVQRSVCCLGVTRCSFFIFLYFFSSISFSCCYLFLTPRILEIFLFGHFFACFSGARGLYAPATSTTPVCIRSRPVCSSLRALCLGLWAQACLQLVAGHRPLCSRRRGPRPVCSRLGP